MVVPSHALRKAQRPVGRLLYACLTAGLLIAAPARAANLINIFSVQGISQTGIFDKSLGGSGEWTMPITNLAGSTLLRYDDPFDLWNINPVSAQLADGSISWTGNPLLADYSSGASPHSLAEGLFGGGGAMEIRGDLYDLTGTVLLADDALLLTANVGGFRIRETTADTNLFDIIGTATVVPTGGLLFENNSDGLPNPGGPALGFFGSYEMSLSGASALNPSGYLDNFQSDVDLVSSLQFTLTSVPEPASAALLIGGLATCLVGRHGKLRRRLIM